MEAPRVPEVLGFGSDWFTHLASSHIGGSGSSGGAMGAEMALNPMGAEVKVAWHSVPKFEISQSSSIKIISKASSFGSQGDRN